MYKTYYFLLLLTTFFAFSACRPLSKQAQNTSAYLWLYADSSQLSGVYMLDIYVYASPEECYKYGTSIGLFELKNDSLFLSKSLDTTDFAALCGRVIFNCQNCVNPDCACVSYLTTSRTWGCSDLTLPFGATNDAATFRVDSINNSHVYTPKIALKFTRNGHKAQESHKGTIRYIPQLQQQNARDFYEKLSGWTPDCECPACAQLSVDSIARAFRALPNHK